VIIFVLQFGVCGWYHKTHAAIHTSDDADGYGAAHE
jgi:hypothetical protein